MKKNTYKSFERKYFMPPSVYQLADIKILLARHDTLTRQLLMPFSTAITMLLPVALSFLMTPGGLFHRFYTFLSVAYNDSSFHAKPGRGDPAVAITVASASIDLPLLPIIRTNHQEVLVKVLEKFHEVFVLQLFVLKILKTVSSRKDVGELIKLEADILETERLIVPDTQPPLNIHVAVSRYEKNQAKQKFIEALLQLNSQAMNPVINEPMEYKKSKPRQDGERIYQDFRITVEDKWLKKSFPELAELIAKIYYRLINEVNSFEVRQLAQLTLFEKMVAQDVTAPHLILFSILGSLLVSNLIIYPALKWAYQKNDVSQALIDLNKEYLSSERADKFIDLLRKRNAVMQKKISRFYKFLQAAAPSVVTVKGLYDYYYHDSLSPGLVTAGLWAVGSSLYDGFIAARTYRQQRGLDKEIKSIAQNLDLAVSYTHQTWETFFPHCYSDCYFEYVAKQFDSISAGEVNKIVMDIFRDNKIDILSWGKYSHTVAPQSMSVKTALKINSQIQNYLDTVLKIRQLKNQIKECFGPENIVEMRIRDKQKLPQIKLVINCSQILNFDLIKFQTLFNQCAIERTGDYLVITGNTPSKSREFSRRKKFIYKAETGLAPAKNIAKSDDQKQKLEKIKTSSDVPNLGQFMDQKSDDTDKIRIEWSKTLVYVSERDGAIKPIDHPIFSKNHFVVFNIPEHCFPTPQLYKSAKEKVEEARLAKSSKNEQGLQFRAGLAIDQTRPGNQPFEYLLRMKLLGVKDSKGDIRLFAKPHTVGSGVNKKVLHEFVAAEIHSH